MKNRDVSIDILKGIGIIFMLSAHSLGGYMHSFAYSFHMPLFFIVSGYFFRPKTMNDIIFSSFRRLIVPLVFTTLLMLVISIIESIIELDGVKKPIEVIEMLLYANGSPSNYQKLWGDFSCIGSPWFLGCLFWAKIIYGFLHSRLTFGSLVLTSFVLSGISVICGQYFLLPYSLLQGFSVLPFFCIGEYASKEKLTNKLNDTHKIVLWILVIGWFVSTFYDVLSIAAFKWRWFVIPNVLFASAGVWVMFLISKYIAQIDRLPWLSKILAIVGEYSIVFVCFPVIESYFIPLKEIVADIPFKMVYILLFKVIWALLTFWAVTNIQFLRNVFGVKKLR